MKKYIKGLLFAFSLSEFAIAAPGYTLHQLAELAIQNNNDLKAAQYNITKAKGRLIQAGLWPNPSLNLANTTDRGLSNEGEFTRSAGFSQAFPISGRIGQQKKVARVDIAIAMAEIRNAKRLLKGSVADNYYALLITDYRLKQLNSLLAINKKLVRLTQNRFRAAEVSELDSNTARLEYQRILQEKQILESFRISQAAQLNQLLGRSASTSIKIKDELPPLKPLHTSYAEAQELAIKQRPDMHILMLSLHRAQAEQQLARTERWADWNLGVAVQENKQVVQGTPPQFTDRALNFSLAIPLPLNNANQGRVMEAGALGTQMLAKMRGLKLVIQTEVASNYTQLQALENGLQQSRSGTQKLKLQNVKLARDAYRNGQISLLEVLLLQRQQNDLQVAYLNMLEKYLQALVRLCTALGNNNDTVMCPYLSDKRNLHGFVKSSKT